MILESHLSGPIHVQLDYLPQFLRFAGKFLDFPHPHFHPDGSYHGVEELADHGGIVPVHTTGKHVVGQGSQPPLDIPELRDRLDPDARGGWPPLQTLQYLWLAQA